MRTVVVAWLLVGCSSATFEATNATPSAQITFPTPLSALVEGVPTTLLGQAGDKDDALDSLRVTWRVDGVDVCEGLADGTGGTACDYTPTVDAREVQLIVTDDDGASDLASVALAVSPDAAPQVEISRPEDGAVAVAGVAVTLEATVEDDVERPGELTLRVVSDRDGALASPVADDVGRVTAQVVLSLGRHLLAVEATDRLGHVGRDAVVVDVEAPNAAPTCAWVSPTDGAVWTGEGPWDVRVAVGDDTTPAASLSVSLTSDRDGALVPPVVDSSGAGTLSLSALSYGSHRLTLSVADDAGAACEASVVVTRDRPPGIAWQSPAEGAVLSADAAVPLSLSVSDDETGPSALSVSITSDVDGLLRLGGADADGTVTLLRSLSPGPHTLRASVIDGAGQETRATRTVRIDRPATAPTVHIEPERPGTSDDLVAVLDTPPSDPDGDPFSLVWTWTVDGAATPFDGPTVPAAATTAGEVWTVSVRAVGALVPGDPGTDAVAVANSAPTLGLVRIAPTAGDVETAWSCVAEGLSDVDGDAVAVALRWWLDGTLVASGPALPSGVAARGTRLVCTGTPSDGQVEGLEVPSAPVDVGNAPPSVGFVALMPEAPDVTTTWSCQGQDFSDPDGDSVTGQVRWTVDGVVVGEGATLPAGAPRGAEVGCTVTPDDGLALGAPASRVAVVGDAPPALLGVVLSPDPGDATTPFVCVPGLAVDPDGDAVQVAVAWTVDGVDAGTGTTLPVQPARGQVVGCLATPWDGERFGEPVGASVVVGNAAPTLLAAALGPDPLYTDDIAVVTGAGSDPDGDAVTLDVAWFVNGVPAGSGTSLSGALFARGDSVSAVVAATDGSAESVAVVLGPVVVADSPARPPEIAVVPEAGRPHDVLQCVVLTPAYDPDGDANALAFAWTGPTGTQLSTLETTAYADDTVPRASVVAGVFTCTVTPSQPTAGWTSVSASATITPLWPGPLVALSTADVQIYGDLSFDHLGEGPCGVATPDVDGDGRDDVAITVAERDGAAGTDVGGVAVFLAPRLVAGARLAASTADVWISGYQAAGTLGRCLQQVPDLDGDGRDELLVAAPDEDRSQTSDGVVRLYRGATLVPGSTVTVADADGTWWGAASSAVAGTSMAAADVDSGGLADLIVGAPAQSAAGVGNVYILRGESLPGDGRLDVVAWRTLSGGATGDRLGESLAALGDADGDGLAELAAGAPGLDRLAPDVGGVVVWSGAEVAAGGALTPAQAEATWVGARAYDGAGGRMAAADGDGDGLLDLLVAGLTTDGSAADVGRVDLIPAAAIGFVGDGALSGVSLSLVGVGGTDVAGTGLGWVPDLSDDGLPEILVGAPNRDVPVVNGGVAALVPSQQAATPAAWTLDDADHRFTASSSNDRAGFVAGGADVDDDGRGDLWVVAPLENDVVASGGRLYLFFAP